ncbi:acyl-CoA N-acyltransferase [Lentinula raphanica]|nr:acyl-CoA N-acyltransferase [Lentinula raphanica]
MDTQSYSSYERTQQHDELRERSLTDLLRNSATLSGSEALGKSLLQKPNHDLENNITYRVYTGESDLPHVMALVESELSEPYVIYTFRYFLSQWPHLAFLAYSPQSPTPVGVIVCKQDLHRNMYNRGYIAMLSVDKGYRKRGIASTLVRNSMEAMKEDGVEEIVLETEYDNLPALSLYESLGFIREKRLFRFYLNGKDAFRLVLTVPPQSNSRSSSFPTPGSSGSSRNWLTESDSGEDGEELERRPHAHDVRRRRPGAVGPRRYRAIRVTPYSDEDEDEGLSQR